LLVVPCYHHQPSTPAFERWIETRLRCGDEIALHGLTHLDEGEPATTWHDRMRRRSYTAGEGEFAALDRHAARERLDAGLRWFRATWLAGARGFVAPAWLLSAGAWSALCEQPFDYTCTLTQLVSLRSAGTTLRALNAWSLVFSTRSAWRRQASLLWNTALAQWHHNAPLVRFELHPSDVQYAAVSDKIVQLLQRAHAGRTESTDTRRRGRPPVLKARVS